MSGNKSNKSDLQLKKLLDKLEKRRAELNRAAEEEFISGGDLSKVLAREEHAAFQKASQEYESFLKETEAEKEDRAEKPE